jgi:transposase
MEVVHARCCGLDVHKRQVVACLLTPAGKEVQTFGTMTAEVLRLADWLQAGGCTHVAMESTGVFWKPIYNLLEGSDLTLLVVNAQHIKAVPGRKTDVRDAEWIADLLRHGLLRPSFIPARPQRELQELVRYRRSLVEERAREANRIQKVLEGANIKLGSVISNVLGVSGRAMLEALAAGITDAQRLAGLARPRLEATPAVLQRALEGRVEAHQQQLLGRQLRHIGFLDEQVAGLDQEIAARVRPFEAALARLDTIPGVSRRVAQEVLASIGTDMTRFPSAGHLASWAKLCPGTNQSAGKQRSSRTGHGNATLRSALTEAAWAASHTRTTYLAAQFRRLAARRGRQRAIVAVAHTILRTIYHMLRDGSDYRELGATYFDERNKDAVATRAVARLQGLGFRVTLEPVA